MTPGFYYALDVISQSIFGERFQTMQDVNNRWMTTSLERGNKHMYLQLAWPDLFKRLGLFVDVELLTYPQLYQESKMFLDLCQKSLEAGKLGERESIFGLMKAELPKEVSNDELHVDAYSFMRGGMRNQSLNWTTLLLIFVLRWRHGCGYYSGGSLLYQTEPTDFTNTARRDSGRLPWQSAAQDWT